MNVLETVARILASLPPEAVNGFGSMLSAILSGKPDKAAQHARVTAAAVAAAKIVEARRGK